MKGWLTMGLVLFPLMLSGCGAFPWLDREAGGKSAGGSPYYQERERSSAPIGDTGARASHPPGGVFRGVEPETAPLLPSPDVVVTRGRMDGAVELRGSGVFIRGTRHAVSPGGAARSDIRDITLNFDQVALAKVVDTVLGEVLQRNYLIDPEVRGQVTLHTSSPVSEADLLPILESLLQSQGAMLVDSGNLLQVLPASSSVGAQASIAVGRQGGAGAGVQLQVVPLRYIAAAQMQKLLTPFAGNTSQIAGDQARNLLLISAPRAELAGLLETIRVFDVDWLQGMSLGLYPLHSAQAGALVEELRLIFNTRDEGALQGVLQVEPIERLNAVLVLSKQPRYLEQARDWVRRLDRGDGAGGRQLRFYPVRNGKASYYADLLRQLFSVDAGSSGGADRGTARSLRRAGAPDPPRRSPLLPPEAPDRAVAQAGAQPPAPGADSGVNPLQSPITIIADEVNNHLLVMASVPDHRTLENALNMLEVRPRQVLIEATIAEVTLTDNLAYGLQWFLKHNLGRFEGISRLGDFSALGGGFSTTFREDGQLRLLFDALASESRLKVLSSPHLMVIDNQSGSIRVGNQIPIVTRQASSIDDVTAPIVSEVTFRDTGVLLRVTPQIHAEGLVRLEVNLEVSEPSADAFAAGNVSILQRSIQSSVVVQSGETIVLGGLILENKTQSESGVPVLYRIPGIGKLFSRTVDDTARTELMVTLTPRVVTSQDDAQGVAEELRRRLRALSPVGV